MSNHDDGDRLVLRARAAALLAADAARPPSDPRRAPERDRLAARRACFEGLTP